MFSMSFFALVLTRPCLPAMIVVFENDFDDVFIISNGCIFKLFDVRTMSWNITLSAQQHCMCQCITTNVAMTYLMPSACVQNNLNYPTKINNYRC